MKKQGMLKQSIIAISVILVLGWNLGNAQVQSTEKRYIRIGSLQSHFSAYGSERAWNNRYYEGLRWPAEYPMQDNSVIKRFWIGCEDFKDELGSSYEKYVIYFAASFVDEALYPMELKQIAKFEPPYVYVDGNNLTAPYMDDIDEINPNIVPDRIIKNVVNTSMGLTLKRTIYAFSQQYHDNYYIKIFTFVNTGNTDYDDEIELPNQTLKGVRIAWGTRYSVCREGATVIGGPQQWGKFSWTTRRGEDYAAHATEQITLNNPIVEWLRCGFQWAGQGDVNTVIDNIGAPDYTGTGRLKAPHHAGVAILHVDKGPNDRSDDPNQPVVLGWHAGDKRPDIQGISKPNEPQMIQTYNTILSGSPYMGLGGNERFDEKYMESNPVPYTVHNDAGGTNIWVAYGPWDLAPGDSITIVEAEGVSGLSRTMAELIGRRWKEAYDNPEDKGPFELPDGSTTDDKDVFKNEWVYTGKDSILLTFSRAKRNYDMDFQIPHPPLPPPVFQVESGGDLIKLSWSASPSEGDPDFGGYRIFRAVGKPDTVFNEIFACGKGTDNPEIVHSYNDINAVRGYSYYYYIVAFNDGSNNQTDANPHGSLHSSKYYTRTTEPAYLKRKSGTALNQIRIVPNPYYIKASAREMQFPKEYDKIMFYNIPGKCKISIYTERGDLIATIDHNDGSGDEAWNSITDYRQVIVSGIYLVHFEVTENIYDPETSELLFKKGDSITKKLIVIR
ncbi:fibronectin [Caldithrix abyssi]